MSSDGNPQGAAAAPVAQAQSYGERVTLRLPLKLSGTDEHGREFAERGCTKILSRNGAAIIVNRQFAPGQILTMRWVGDKVKVDVRIIGQFGTEAEGNVYGVAFVDPGIDFWHIQFAAEADRVLLRVLLECPNCRNREIVPLSEFELSVFQTNASLSRRCSGCGQTTLWTESKDDRPPDFMRAVAGPTRTATAEQVVDRRAAHRTNMKLQGCVLFCQQECPVDVVEMAPAGIRFHCAVNFPNDLLMRVAVPYTPGAANIFVAARVRWSQPLSSGGFEHGMEYVKG